MMMRVDRLLRLKAGLLLAAIYLFSVLTAGLSFAFGEARNAGCTTDGNLPAGIVYVHDQDARITQHVGGDRVVHELSRPASTQALSEGGSSVTFTEAPESDQHKSADRQCCGRIYVTALPATVTEFVQPSVSSSLCAAAPCRDVAENAPARLHRPPIT